MRMSAEPLKQQRSLAVLQIKLCHVQSRVEIDLGNKTIRPQVTDVEEQIGLKQLEIENEKEHLFLLPRNGRVRAVSK